MHNDVPTNYLECSRWEKYNSRRRCCPIGWIDADVLVGPIYQRFAIWAWTHRFGIARCLGAWPKTIPLTYIRWWNKHGGHAETGEWNSWRTKTWIKSKSIRRIATFDGSVKTIGSLFGVLAHFRRINFSIATLPHPFSSFFPSHLSLASREPIETLQISGNRSTINHARAHCEIATS